MKFLSLCIIPLASAHVVRSQQQIPIIGEVVENTASQVPLAGEDIEDVAPSIGVHFTTSYAVAAARYQNGTVRNLAKVEGDEEYIELMSRWMDSYSKYSWKDDCSRTLDMSSGQFKPGCNIPTDRDAIVLPKFLLKVRAAIEAELGASITSIAPAIFPLDPYKTQGFRASIELAGLTSTRYLARDGFEYQEVKAAYAGLGHGLCHDMSDYMNCMNEEIDMPYRDVLFLNFDNSSFSASVHSLKNAYQEYSQYGYIAHSELGWWNLPIFEARRAKFWAKIHEVVVDVASLLQRPPSRIVLMGEHGGDGEFKAVVEAALRSVLEVDVKLMLQAVKAEDAGNLAARGAAEMAWRSGYWNSETQRSEGVKL